MSKRNYASVNEIIAKNSHYVLKTAQKGVIARAVKDQILAHFSPQLALQLKPLSIQSKILNVSAPNASVATKARFEINAVIQNIKQQNSLPAIESIQINVSTTRPTRTQKKPTNKNKPLAISLNSKKKIDNIAEKIKDEHLRSALEKLTKK
jgi:hypothetical protein